ncbi:MAG: RNA polymerase sigma factor [Bryobacteraceae bacterium]|nr:MAG: RNA polymerase sigma factor [Bryobacteraceae bacterium]
MAVNTQPSDEDLVQRYYACDDAALDELQARYRRQLYAFFTSSCGDATEAEDLAQETLIKIIYTKGRNQARFQPGSGSFRNWLFSVATNVLYDAIRRKQPTKPLAGDEREESGKGLRSSGRGSVEDSGPGPEKLAIANELLDVLLGCLVQLTDDRRDAVILVYQLRFTAVEAGVIMNREPNAVYQLLHNAIKDLRPCLCSHGYTSRQEIDPEALETANADRLDEFISMLSSGTKIRLNTWQQTQRRQKKGTEYE